MTGSLRAAWRALLLSLWTGLCLAAVFLVRAAGAKGHRAVTELWHRTCWTIMGFDVRVHGVPAAPAPVLFASNHVSYLDIIVLGGIVDGSFVSKDDVASWPVISFFARLQRTVFVRRDGRHARAQREEFAARLRAGHSLILFPEGTSSCGNHTLAFKSSLFSVAELDVGGPLWVQPMSVAYTRLDGCPVGRTMQALFAWYGDMELVPHLWRVLGLGRTQVDVVLHEPVTLPMFASRKALAEYCRNRVAAGAAAARSGRLDSFSPEAAREGQAGAQAGSESGTQSGTQSVAPAQAGATG